ncbi:phage holin family protein [Halomonas rhizosphaerae]|uniref:Phage holin family protein n=1 Tax=Halomonas rhizosphaerae TaxID=3043296 RepID=A0ABT6V002_9GAMM|nr:phage holin family protein [Halomonas rhizosphaerae]MDI5891555.1 phage holin family protein [Halomonas rhizosphaerae]
MRQEQESAAVPSASREYGADSIADLIRNLATDLSTLLGKEIELAKSEVGESVAEAKTAVGAIATGAAIAMAGLVVLLMSAVYGLSNVVEPWLAALIVGAVALLVGYLMVGSAKKKMSANSIVPDRTLESTKKDKETLKRATR